MTRYSQDRRWCQRQKRLADTIPLPWPKSVVLAMFVIGTAVGAVVLYFLTMGGW